MGKFATAAARWAGIGPYYAMFPASFADRVIKRYTRPGQAVLDPFAGRGTAVFSAAVQGRCGIGIEINPVGWIYARTKLSPASREPVEERLVSLETRARYYRKKADELPRFFRHCFVHSVRSFLLAARAELDWRRSNVDRTTMALLLVYLHGKAGFALSNQMRQTKSMSPGYAVRWWKERGLRPPDLNPREFLADRLDWRYAKGVPECHAASRAYLANSAYRLAGLREDMPHRAGLLFTSPPYFGLTNYHYDQWLRLWLLGEEPNARRKPGRHRAKFENRESYEQLLTTVFTRAAQLCTPKATIYVRTGRQKITSTATRRVLKAVFPRHRMVRRPRPFRGPTQTRLFGDHSVKLGEIDFLLLAR